MTSRAELGQQLALKMDLIPERYSNRPGTFFRAGYITIHNTDNTNRGAGARAHASYIKTEAARRRKVSWHYSVDDKEVYKHLPISEVGWHASTSTGNSRSIGIEICMNRDGNENGARERTAKLVAILMFDLGIPLSNIVTHNYWSGKRCPSTFFEAGSNRLSSEWYSFLDKVKSYFTEISNAVDNSIAARDLLNLLTIKPDNVSKLRSPLSDLLPEESRHEDMSDDSPFAFIGADSEANLDVSGHAIPEDVNSPFFITSSIQQGGVNLDVPYLSQTDNWIAPLATCGPTSVAMCLLYSGYQWNGRGQFEDEVKQISDSRGWDHGLPEGLRRLVEYYERQDDLSQSASLNDIDIALNSGQVCIVHGYFTTPGHILVLRGYDKNGNYFVNDPAGEWYRRGYDYNVDGRNSKGKNKLYSRRLISTAGNSWSLRETFSNYDSWSNDQVESTSTIWLHRISS